jgi:hypothetical protein
MVKKKVKKVIKKKNPKGAGRKWFDGKNEQNVLSKLKDVWKYGGTDVEAAFYADISVPALQRYLSANPELREEKVRMKSNPILIARKTVVDGLKYDPDLSLRYLERKKKDEFSLRQEFTGKDGEEQRHIVSVDDLGAIIKSLPKNERSKY